MGNATTDPYRVACASCAALRARIAELEAKEPPERFVFPYQHGKGGAQETCMACGIRGELRYWYRDAAIFRMGWVNGCDGWRTVKRWSWDRLWWVKERVRITGCPNRPHLHRYCCRCETWALEETCGTAKAVP